MARKKLQVGDQAPDGLVLTVDEKEQSLAAFWSEGPTLLTFLRHFG